MAVPLWVKLLGGIALITGVIVVLSLIPTGDVAYAPAVPFDLNGRVLIDGKAAEPVQGRVDLLNVTARPVSLLQRLLLDVTDPSVDFAPEVSEAAVAVSTTAAERDVLSMSQRIAAAVALDLIDPGSVQWSGTGATVQDITPGSPADGQLERGDIIVAVDGTTGTAIDTSVEVLRVIHALRPGSFVTIGVQRAGNPTQLRLRTSPGDDLEAGAASIGAELTTIGLRISLPRLVEFSSVEDAGPTAGLSLSLYVFDSLSPSDLLRGRHVAATGILTPDGGVLAAEHVRQRAIAAQDDGIDLMLVPSANASEARTAISKRCDDGASCVQVVPVKSVSEAVALLERPDDQLRQIAAAG